MKRKIDLPGVTFEAKVFIKNSKTGASTFLMMPAQEDGFINAMKEIGLEFRSSSDDDYKLAIGRVSCPPYIKKYDITSGYEDSFTICEINHLIEILDNMPLDEIKCLAACIELEGKITDLTDLRNIIFNIKSPIIEFYPDMNLREVEGKLGEKLGENYKETSLGVICIP